MSYQHGKLILQSTCSVILRMYKLRQLQMQHAFWRPSFNVSWNIVLFIWWKHVSDFLKHNFETYRFLKQQIMILFSGTMKWNMFQIHLKEMHPWVYVKSCCLIGQYIFSCLAYDWMVKGEWKVTWHDPKHYVVRW